MNLTVKDIDVIISALLKYLDEVIDLDDDWMEIATTILALIKNFKKLRKEKQHE